VVEVDGVVADVMKLHENLKREDVNVVDEAFFLRDVMKRDKLTQKELAKAIGRTEGYVSQRLDLLAGDPKILEALYEGKITFAVARELNRIDDETVRRQYLYHAVTGGLNSTTAQKWVEDYLRARDAQEGYVRTVGGGNGQEKVEVLSLPCAVCQEVKPVTEEKMVRICFTCAKELKV